MLLNGISRSFSQNQLQLCYRGSSTNSGTETDLLSPWSTPSQMTSPENQEGIMQMSIGVNSMLFHQVISDWFEIDVVPILAKYQQESLVRAKVSWKWRCSSALHSALVQPLAAFDINQYRCVGILIRSCMLTHSWIHLVIHQGIIVPFCSLQQALCPSPVGAEDTDVTALRLDQWGWSCNWQL